MNAREISEVKDVQISLASIIAKGSVNYVSTKRERCNVVDTTYEVKHYQ